MEAHYTPRRIETLTQEQGEGWAYPHVKRLLALAPKIAGEVAYHAEWFWYAAYLHDWGAFPCYRQPGVDHALRSRQVIETGVLPFTSLPADGIAVVLEAVERHDYHDLSPVVSPEALLLREADFLDFLGPLGLAREFAWGPNNLGVLVKRARARIDIIRHRFSLPVAREIAASRIAHMERILSCIEEDAGGFL